MDGLLIARVVETLLMAATILALVWVGAPEAAPWRVVARSAWSTLRSGRRALYLGACCSILGANYLYLQLGVDDYFTSLVKAARGGEDFTRAVHLFEGEAVARVQQATLCPLLTWFLAYVYVVVFPCLVFVVLFVFDHLGHRRGLAMMLISYLLNYVFCLPTYLGLPIREVFHYYRHDLGSAAVRLLLDDIHPAVMQAYRAMSGIDNCIPSFHTSLGLTMALLAWHTGRRPFALLMTFLAAANAFSTVYLGIHWVIDVAAGLVVGVLAYALARRLSRRWATEPNAAPARNERG
ncbi:MAG: phosphatase PAP2 family protein [Planctomycetes bacterium]|nr:phosphatase PAP2 family protein [Planctomycetota bacterium]